MISSAFAHFGEEAEITGRNGSGTIFLTHCNLRCIFCQNYEISHLGDGREITNGSLARLMLGLQNQGCHNINFVSPTHFTPQIIAALPRAIEMGLRIPLVYNCSGYESVAVLKLLEGIIDIYMPDAKFFDTKLSEKYCAASDYFEIFSAALNEMHRQVGDLQLNAEGIAERGVLVRHLVMPGLPNDSEKILRFIAEKISVNTFVNIMPQYHPAGQAAQYPELNRRVTLAEMQAIIQFATDLGLSRGF